jgi:molybdate transport system substrate-binding protein
MVELKLLSAGAVKRGVARVAADYERTTGNRVLVEFQTAPQLRERFAAGERADVLVAPPALMDPLGSAGKLRDGTRGLVGHSRMGVVIHANAPVPAVESTDDFVRLLRGAGSLVRNTASSGVYAAKLLERLGLTADLGSRIAVVDTGAAVMEYVAAHPDSVGLAQISEVMVLIDRGCLVSLAAPLPEAVQNVTRYDAAALAGSPEAAADLARQLWSDASRQIFAATGIS